MEPTSILKLAAILAGTAGLCYGLTWIARWVAPTLGFVDMPDGGRKLHSKPTPLLGGAAVYFSFVVGAGTLVLTAGRIQPADLSFGLALLTSAALFCAVGIWDDRHPLRARNKFLLQIVAATPFVALGPTITAIEFMGVGVSLGPLSVLFAVFWIVSCANIFNLIDGLDGLATSVGLVSCVVLAVLSLMINRPGLAGVGFVFAACLAGFLVHNWPPAKIFLGDAGSMTIGFVVGALSIGASLKMATGIMLGFPVVLLSIPILDTLLAILRRRLLGRPIGDADRGHIHHLLQDQGLSKLQALLAIIGLSTAMAGTVILARTLGSDSIAFVGCFVVLVLVIVGRVFGYREMDLALRHVQIVHTVLRNALGGMGARMHLMRAENTDSSNPQMLWSIVESRVEAAGGSNLQLTIDDERQQLARVAAQWSRQDQTGADDGATWDIRLSVPREHGLRATLMASGCCSDGDHERRVEQLVHVFTGVCKSWPAQVSPDAPIVPLHEAGAGENAEPRIDRRAA